MKAGVYDHREERYTMSEKRLEKIKTRAGKKIICLLAAMAVLAAGCGKQDGLKITEGESGGGGNGGQQIITGRYVETETDLPEQMESIAGIYKQPDGKLVIIGTEGDFLVSQDNGASWKDGSRKWIQEKASGSYIMDVKMDSKDIVGIIYTENDGEESSGTDSMFRTSLKCDLLLPDETVIPVQFSMPDEDWIDRFWISDTDRYFVSTIEGNIYEVEEDGSSRLYLMTEGCPQMIQFLGKLMIIDGYDFKAPLLYDMEKEEYVEDEVLAEFVQENYGDRGFNGAGWQNMWFFPGEEDVIYLAGKKGLHRHVMGGATIEQIIDGKLSRLGSPQYGIAGMVFLKEGEFLAVSNNGKVINFTYDSEKEAIPQDELKVYSLEENADMYAAVSFYQIQNPDVFVKYEVGMEQGGAVTKEDAIKKLNTQLMAGGGPDILMLDGLPADSFMEKGLLYDLGDFVDNLEKEEMFENMVRSLEKENGVYAIPGQIKFPVMLGRESGIAKMAGLSSAADIIERMRQNNPGRDLIGLYSEKAIMKYFSLISSQEWKKEEEIDMEAVEEFLTQTKRIYEAQVNGMEEKNAKRLLQSDEDNAQRAGDKWMYDLVHYGFYMDYVAGYSEAFTGVSNSPHSYMELASIAKAEGLKDTILVPLEGKEGRVFIPEIILGISSVTSEKELAEDFLKTFLGKENQGSLSGYSVNRKAFSEAFEPEKDRIGENGEYGTVGVIDEDGREILLNVFIPTDEETAAVREWMETARIPYLEDSVFEECIFEEGSYYVRGEREMEETLKAIEKRLAIYIAE